MSTMSLTESFDGAPLNHFHKRLVVYSSGGPFLDGYVLSVIGMALVQLTPQLGLSLFWEGMIGASALIGIFFGGFIGGWLTDKFGRQILYTIDLIAIGVFSLAQFWVDGPLTLFLLRGLSHRHRFAGRIHPQKIPRAVPRHFADHVVCRRGRRLHHRRPDAAHGPGRLALAAGERRPAHGDFCPAAA